MCRTRVLLLLVLLAGAGLSAIQTGAAPQQPPVPVPAPANQTPAAPAPGIPPDQQPTPIFRAGVKLVRVDVSVLGRDDEAVDDLAAVDFEVKEDGVAQTVETVQFVRLDGHPPPGFEESLEIRSAAHAKAEAAKEDVRLFVVFLDDYHVSKAPHIILPLRRALEDFVKNFGPSDLIAVMDPLTPLSHLKFTRSLDEVRQRMHTFEGRYREIFPVKSAAEEAQLQKGNVWELRAGVTLSALNAVVTHLGGLREGRKSVLFVSQGGLAPRPGSASFSNNDMRLDDVVKAANRGNVTIHVLDPRPLGSAPFGGDYTLRRLSDESGGRAIINTNDPREGLRQVIADASAYYLIGYTPTRDLMDGKFHKIDVRVKRRGMRVLARQGYWAPTEAEMHPVLKEPVAPEVVEALTDLIEPIDGRSINIWVGATRGAEGATRVSITWDPTGRTEASAPVRLDVEPLKEDGSALAPKQSIATGRAASTASIATFEVPPGPTTIRFTVRAADDSVIDQWPERVRIPKLADDLALATPRFLRAQSAFEARAIEKDPEPTPTASRRLRKTDRVLVELELFAPQGVTPDVTVELLNQDGQPLVPLPVPALSSGRARITIPVYSLALSTYILRIQAKAGEQEVRQLAPFRVVP